MQIIENIALISINETLIVQLLSFLIFLYIMNKIMFKPLLATIGERSSYIETLNEEIEQAESEFEKISLELIEKEAKARRQANMIKDAIETEGHEEADKIYAHARNKIDEIKVETEKLIADQLNEARAKSKKETELIAKTMIEKILERGIRI